tara:strand:- start:934 stop:1062 length:129 start_codon:yes stop_codon:yes gene_type:complete
VKKKNTNKKRKEKAIKKYINRKNLLIDFDLKTFSNKKFFIFI